MLFNAKCKVHNAEYGLPLMRERKPVFPKPGAQRCVPSKKHKGKESGNDWDFASMGPIFGVAIGIAVGTVNENIGAALGAGIGMFIGTLIEFFIGKNKA